MGAMKIPGAGLGLCGWVCSFSADGTLARENLTSDGKEDEQQAPRNTGHQRYLKQHLEDVDMCAWLERMR